MAELKTPLTDWHVAHGAKMAPFAGWLMPIQYEGILVEHQHTRQHAGLFDICHMGEFRIRGAGADAALAAVSHNLATLAPGRCRYGFLLTEKGTVLDDCIVYRFGPDDFMVVVNAACAAGDFATLRARLPEGVALTDISEQTGKIDLQGPEAVDVLETLLGRSLRDMPYFGFRSEAWQGCELLVSRTGYTGELGFELYVPAGPRPCGKPCWPMSGSSLWALARAIPCVWKPVCPSMATSWTRTTPRPRRAWAAC